MNLHAFFTLFFSLPRSMLFTVLLVYAQNGVSDGFRISPIKLYFDADSNITSLKIVNDAEAQVTVQLEAMTWSQDQDGQDQYAPTAEVVFFPRILNIEANDQRIIRVGYQGDPATAIEKTYRLFVQELPVRKPGEIEMKFAVRMGVPIFVRPDVEKLAWSVSTRGLVESGLSIRVENTGNRFLMVEAMQAVGRNVAGEEIVGSKDRGWYVLAGQGRNFVLPINKEDCSRVTSLEVAITVDNETRRQMLEVHEGDCAVLANSRPEGRRFITGQ
jgi:fimbrial chaperone protein